MLKKRLIPKLLIKHRPMGRSIRPVLVTTRSFHDAHDVGDPVSQAKIYEAQLADELVVLNIGLDLKVISPTLFAMMVLMALVTTIATTPMLQMFAACGARPANAKRQAECRGESG